MERQSSNAQTHNGMVITILLLWLIEPDVFQMPQLHKHFSVVVSHAKNADHEII